MAFPAFLQRLHQLGTGAPAPPPPPAPAPTYTTTTPTTSGCPFGFGGSAAIDAAADAERQPTTTSSTTPPPPLPPPLFGAKKVQLLYETYIHLPDLRDVWERPLTAKPELEPCFAAACHALEIAFCLTAHMLEDTRAYVVKRPRVELVAEDVARQCALLAEIVDGELEEDPPAPAASPLPSPPTPTTSDAFPKPSDTSGGGGGGGGLASPLSTGSLSSLTTAATATAAAEATTPVLTGTTTAAGAGGDGPPTPLALGTVGRSSSSSFFRSSLTQDFPFPGCPPTTSEAARSPALELLREAVRRSLPALSPSERVSLVKIIRNITNAIAALVESWTVGLGLEPQLNGLRALVGLRRIPSFDGRALFLDYARIVRPGVVASTYEAARGYEHAEDFFFRSVHLGTECWAFVANARLEGARALAAQGEWHNASARARQAAHIFTYLGTHVQMLTSMVLRDYLELKVEIEGTSGEGSQLVRAFRPVAKRLFSGPFKAALLALPLPKEMGEGEEEEEEMRVRAALLAVYEAPERHPQLYTYAKALELLETGLVSGFYYGHFCLATAVIGLAAKGTMHRAVSALKRTYETPLFPLLDQTRSALGARVDARLRHRKGNLLRALLLDAPAPGPVSAM